MSAPPLVLLDTGGYEETTVTVRSTNGTELGTVDVRIADTQTKRVIGLSRTDRLAANSGMLFVHETGGSKSYVMRNMSFAIDIIFIDGDGTITEVTTAQPPPDDEPPYTGIGQYVLEVPAGWAAERGVEPGDRVEIPDSVRAP
ncbi:DUF192 domain-containing protein [Halovenus sp. WSH3]|uniref:DUF192 domain-containing protein n=2 Tax=Halovenus carboxidivorans TaxID=2692199 RepID=A0A6B0SXP6_9EURY|nr:DUF192 domain-containing protein [Halovenus carboxidivorans]MXR50304.1 DUF192 domain-containing protein [Halovenus carboxidivorans]